MYFDAAARKTILSRFTALWALNEAAFGGLLHVLHIPFTGILVGGSTVIILSFLARLEITKTELVKALFLVLIIKAGVSPHSPVMAYVAVTFQALLMLFIFGFSFSFKLKLFVFAFIALIQSGLQKLVVLVVVFGLDVISAIDSFSLYVFEQIGLNVSDNFSIVLLVISIYLILHVIAGFFLGVWLNSFVNKVFLRLENYSPVSIDDIETFSPKVKKGKRFNVIYLIMGLLVVIALISYFVDAFNNNLYYKVSLILIRSILIILFWIYVISPLLKRLINRYLTKEKSIYKNELTQIRNDILYMRKFIRFIWIKNRQLSFFRRINKVLENIFLTIMAEPIEKSSTN